MKILQFLVVLSLCAVLQAGVDTGTFKFPISSPSEMLNVTVVFQKCFYTQTLKVEARARPTDTTLGYTFKIFPFKLNMLSFEAILQRTDQTAGWNYTEITVDWRAYFPSELLNQPPGYDISYTHLSSSSMTWASAQTYCIQQGSRICNATEICSNKKVSVIGTAWGPNWVPISVASDPTGGKWMQIGDDNGKAGRFCLIHQGKPGWGQITGNCGISTIVDPCYPKGHLFCCKP